MKGTYQGELGVILDCCDLCSCLTAFVGQDKRMEGIIDSSSISDGNAPLPY